MAIPTGQNLRSFTEQYVSQLPNPALATKGGSLYFLDGIPKTKLQNARSSYANYAPTREAPLLLLDTTVFGSGKKGMLMTDQSVYYSEIGCKGSQALDSIRQMEATQQGTNSSRIIKIIDSYGKEDAFSFALTRSEYQVLRLYIENIPSFTLPKPSDIAMIEPWRDAPWLEKISFGMPDPLIDRLCGTFVTGEVLQEERHGLYFTSHRILCSAWFVFYEEIKGVKVHSHKRHTHVPHIGHNILLNVALHLAGAANDHLNLVYSIHFVLKADESRSLSFGDLAHYQSDELRTTVRKYGIPLLTE